MAAARSRDRTDVLVALMPHPRDLELQCWYRRFDAQGRLAPGQGTLDFGK